jgi:uncharacterized zinc-type alcohol dehydrogenase-like protein
MGSIHVNYKFWWFSKYPSCPGHEVVGVVERIGAGVTKFKVGEKVGCNP